TCRPRLPTFIASDYKNNPRVVIIKRRFNMASSSHSSHEHDPHHWDSAEYVSNWAKGQDPKERNRQEAFRMLADTIPFNKTLPIRILDLGAGYGGFTEVLVERFPHPPARCARGLTE